MQVDKNRKLLYRWEEKKCNQELRKDGVDGGICGVDIGECLRGGKYLPLY